MPIAPWREGDWHRNRREGVCIFGSFSGAERNGAKALDCLAEREGFEPSIRV